MEKENIKIEGNFAVKIGKMWAVDGYNLELREQPKSLLGFKDAHKVAEKTGGKIVMFKPIELSDDELVNLKLAAGLTGKEDED